MREDRFLVNFEIKKGKVEISEREIFHQIKNVLRKRVAERVIFWNGKGKEAKAEIKKFQKNKILFEILEIRENQREPQVFLSLFCSILKKSNFELVCQKATEIGVKEIVPIITKNTVKLNLNFKRLEKIIKEAAEQSKRGILPKLGKILTFREALKKVQNFELKILFDESGKNFKSLKTKAQKRGVFVGPEGGWDRAEIELAKKENFQILNLGKLNLRSETAAILATFLTRNF